MSKSAPVRLESLRLEKPVYGGDTLAHLSNPDGRAGKAVFVPLALPGEIVSAHITEDKRTFAKAELDQVLTPSPNRISPPCPHFGPCGGCNYQHADYPTQLEMKERILRELLTRGGVSTPAQIEVLSGNPWAYRNRIRLAMTPAGELAYRSRRSHDLIPVRECPIAAPILFQTAQILREHLGTAPIPITELELFTNPDQSRLLITLFCEEEPEANPQRWLDERNAVLSAVLPTPTAGLRLQRSDGALIPKILASSGETSLTYSAANFLYRVDHGAFFQVNRWLIDEFLCRAITGLEGQTAWDLYAGVGLFARQLSHSFSQVIAVESAPASTAALRFNLEGTNARAVASTTLDYLRHNREQRQPRPDLILLDPPRAGLGDQVTTLLNAIGAPAIIYVSCDPTTLARDLRALTQERYQIDKITLVDLFPQTFHLETVVHLRRS